MTIGQIGFLVTIGIGLSAYYCFIMMVQAKRAVQRKVLGSLCALQVLAMVVVQLAPFV